jgi:hypothetical protein
MTNKYAIDIQNLQDFFYSFKHLYIINIQYGVIENEHIMENTKREMKLLLCNVVMNFIKNI